MTKRVFVSAGEYSGSLYMASILRRFHELHPEVKFFGVGGSEMQEAGVELLYNSDSWGSIGLVEAFKRWRLIPVNFHLRRILEKEKPDLLLLADYPGFNMPLVRKGQGLGIKSVYLFPPRKFARRAEEVAEAAKAITRVAAEFEPTYTAYLKAGAQVDFVGHPMLDILPREDRHLLREKNGIQADEKLVLVMPGSRAQEVSMLLPEFAGTLPLIHAKVPKVRFVMLGASNFEKDSCICECLKAFCERQRKAGLNIELVFENRFHWMQQADFALVSSGTATMELLVYGVPMIICYRVSLLTEVLARTLTRELPDNIGLPNLLAGKRIVPEFIQRQATPEVMAKAAIELLLSQELQDQMRLEFEDIRAKLGGTGSIDRLCRALAEELGLQ